MLHNDGIAVGASDFLTGKVEHDAWARGDVSGPQFHVLAANKELTVDGRRVCANFEARTRWYVLKLVSPVLWSCM